MYHRDFLRVISKRFQPALLLPPSERAGVYRGEGINEAALLPMLQG